MSITFFCSSCNLWFELGSFLSRYDFVWITYLVCSVCGTCHQIRVGGKHSKGWESSFNTLVDAEDGPLFMDQQEANRAHFRHKGRQCREYAEKIDRDATQEFITSLVCCSCNQEGSLTAHWERDNHTCPHCKQESLEDIGSAIT